MTTTWIANASPSVIVCPACSASVHPGVEHRHVEQRVIERTTQLSDSSLPLLPISTLRDHLAAQYGTGCVETPYLQRVAAAVARAECERGTPTTVAAVLDAAEQQALAVLDARAENCH